MNFAPWEQISEGSSGLVLAVDFDATGRAEATFSELVQLLPKPMQVWQTTQPPRSDELATQPEAYLRWWHGRPKGAGGPAKAILGYCAGSVFASALADELKISQGVRPKVVLFNPGRPNTQTLDRDFRAAIGMLDPLAPQEQAEFLASAESVLSGGDEWFDSITCQVLRLYLEAGSRACARLDLDPDTVEKLLGLFVSYTSYLRAARALGYRSSWASATAIISMEPVYLNGFAEESLRLSVKRADLLRSVEAARIAYEAITCIPD